MGMDVRRMRRLKTPFDRARKWVERHPAATVTGLAVAFGGAVLVRVGLLRVSLAGHDPQAAAVLDSIAATVTLVTAAGIAVAVWVVRKLETAWSRANASRADLERLADELSREVAERAKAERALAAANERLSASHAQLERWAADLEIAHARLREVDDLKTKFLSEVAHELRSPMAAVVSAAKIIVKHHKTKPEVIERFGRTIVSEGARMTRLINDFLDLAKIESGAIEWSDGEVRVDELIRDAVHGIDALAVERDIHVETDVCPDLPLLRVDRDRLFRVVTNLLGNAIKYTPREGTIRVRAWRDGENVLVAVDDTGPGIPPEEREKVFDRFHQVCAGRQNSGSRSGTGLGLCIAREIVEHYGGRIWVESELGKGSSFRFTIPATGRAQDEAVAARDAERLDRAARVLLLFDDPADGARIEAVRPEEGLDCRLCHDFDGLVRAADEWHPDAVVFGAATFTASADRVLSFMRGHPNAKLLVYSREHGFTAPSMLDSAEVLIPTLRSGLEAGSLVYVVDDDPDYRGILEFEVGQAGYAVCSFPGGQEVLEGVERNEPDAMILDLIMPGIDGLTVLERLRKEGRRFPIYVYTGLDDPSVALAAKELGATEVFRKDGGGVTYAAVCSRISRVLGPLLAAGDGHEANRNE
ncbi:MAG: response regulator [Candidatus Dadabacteria bacterium]|nr:MAG: response regulator [Candidatus Dadabacteria bacterium]